MKKALSLMFLILLYLLCSCQTENTDNIKKNSQVSRSVISYREEDKENDSIRLHGFHIDSVGRKMIEELFEELEYSQTNDFSLLLGQGKKENALVLLWDGDENSPGVAYYIFDSSQVVKEYDYLHREVSIVYEASVDEEFVEEYKKIFFEIKDSEHSSPFTELSSKVNISDNN